MHKLGCPKFDLFQPWVSTYDWPKLLKEVENKYIYPFLVYQLYRQSKTPVTDEINTTVYT